MMKQMLSVGLLAAAGMMAMPASAQTLQLEGAVAVPLTEPQTSRFSGGGSASIKPTVELGQEYVDFSPAFSVTSLAHESPYTANGSMWSVGGQLRLKRPHSFAQNTSEGFNAMSPYVAVELAMAHTGDLNRFATTAEVGVDWAVDNNRKLWIGPIVKFSSVLQDPKAGFNTNDARMLMVGLNMEIDPWAKRPAPVAVPVKPQPQPTVEVRPLPPVITARTAQLQLHEIVQFKVNSWALDEAAKAKLDSVLTKLSDASYSGIVIDSFAVEGAASKDGIKLQNDMLARKRSEAVRDYFVKAGVASSQIAISSFGSDHPAYPDYKDRALNRRAEVSVSVTVTVTKSR